MATSYGRFNDSPAETGQMAQDLMDELESLSDAGKDQDEVIPARDTLLPTEADFRDFIETAAIGLHCVGPDGTISWANEAEFKLLGYTREEYLGRHVKDFHADLPVIEDILARLSRGERLKDHPARLLCKDGSIRHVLIDSSARFENGKFVHSRCFTRDVTERKQINDALQASERRLQEIIRALPAAIYTTDAEGRITMFNQAAVEFSGRVPELGSDSWCVSWKLYSPDGTPMPHDECPMALAIKENRSVRGCEAIAERPDGTRVHFIPYPTPLYDDAGRLKGAVNMLVDITAHKRAEEALLQSEERLRFMAESMPQKIFTASVGGEINYFNQQWLEFTGLSCEEVEACKWDQFVHPDDLQETLRLWKLSIESGEPFKLVHRVRRFDGVYRWHLSRADAMRDNKGAISIWIGSNTEIHEQIERENELRRANADLEQFAYSASHDLQEPIRNVAVYTELLSTRHSDALDAKGRQYLEFIMDGARRMEMLVKDLLAYTRSGETPDGAAAADAETALAKALSNLAEAVREAGAVITRDVVPALPLHEVQLQQLFQNLIGNAIKYRRAGDPPRIHIAAERQGTHWKISVRDNGIGISPEHKERVFGLFKRLHNQKQYSGSGIGLAICQRIVERNGGRIWVESDGPGTGSTFCFTIPIR
jgi:PAS domain S-box-containing protein